LGVALPRVLRRDRPGADAGEAAEIAGKARLVRPVVVHRRLGIGPGAVEQEQQAVMEDVGEAGEGGVALLLLPPPRVLGQMERQRPLRSEQAEEADPQAGGRAVRLGRRERRQIGRRKRKIWFLAEPDRLLRGAVRAAEARHIGVRPLQQAQRLQEVEPEGFGRERRFYSRCRLPSRVGHRMISPRSSVVTTVSVKLFSVTYLAKNCSSTAPSRNALGPRRLCSSSSSSICSPRPKVIGPGTGRRRTTGLLATRTTASSSLEAAGAS